MITEAMEDIKYAANCIDFRDIELNDFTGRGFVDFTTHGDYQLGVSGKGCHSQVELLKLFEMTQITVKSNLFDLI